jgi:glutamate-1-semialdehyde 2,1-aminomutase
VPTSAGVTFGAAADTLTADFNSLSSVEAFFNEYPNDIAAIVIEPVAANMGVVLPQEGFLEGLRALCDKYGALLVFDEVITGFRLAAGGAQAYFGVRADLVCYGKIIGGGLPMGAYAGSRELMRMIAPSGAVYQAGTLSGNPIATAAGLAMLDALEDGQVYVRIESMAGRLAEGMREIVGRLGVRAAVNQIGSLTGVFFGIELAESYAQVMEANTSLYARYFKAMLKRGVYLAPAQFEAMFVSDAHTAADIETTLTAFERVMEEISVCACSSEGASISEGLNIDEGA